MQLTRREHHTALTSKHARRAIVSLFAMFALALCMFAMSSASGHQPSNSSHHAATTQQTVSSTGSAQATGPISAATGTLESGLAAPSPQCDPACDSHSAFTSAACTLVIVLFGFALLAFYRRPFFSVLSRLMTALHAAGTLPSLNPPSLVSLSISRT